ncbi:MAG: hypothetical protein LBU65_14315 [Planctomycetaceae bacterium]|nr:hypothetical protein [Planctomycetaceae bacterium]
MTNEIQKHSELHLFIDESGKFSKRDINLVGGVLLFGQFDAAVQSGIKGAIFNACQSVDVQYPPHYNQLGDNAEIFSGAVTKNLEKWQKRTDTSIYGIFIHHKKDIYENAPPLLNEREIDNRYLSMVWSLIEHLCFASEEVANRITDSAKIHLHIAARKFPILPEERDYFENLGYEIMRYRNIETGELEYTGNAKSLQSSDIVALFRSVQRTRWTNSKLILETVTVDSINYFDEYSINKPESPSPLYLADIVLGVERKRLRSHSGMIAQRTLPIFESLEYEPVLEAVMQYKAYIANDNLEALFGSIAENPFDPSDLQNQDFVDELVTEYKKNKEPFNRLYETAVELVDHPLQREKAVKLSKLLNAIIEKSSEVDLQSKLYSLLFDFSFANHTGNVVKGNSIWEQWLKYEPQLPSLGLECGMNFYTDFRLRRAVNLMDTFQYAEAEAVLLDGNTKEEDRRMKAAELFNCKPEQIDAVQIGKIYNTLGQSLAFQGNDLQWAENSFRYAIECFKEENDIERSWVYLGHLACDHPDKLAHLWTEANEHLPGGDAPRIKPFVFALKLKAILLFYGATEQDEWIKVSLNVLQNCPDNVRSEHPWGMVIQTTALICAKLYRETNDNIKRTIANDLFDWAIDSFSHGESMLQHIGNVCKLRKKQFNGAHLTTGEQEQINQLRFNYW